MREADLQATIALDVPPDVVLTAFQAIERWSTWYPGVVEAGWVTGEAWQVGAVMAIAVRNSLGMLVKSTAVVLPAADQIAHESALCWENRAPGLVTGCYAWAEATATGSRFTLQKYYRGPLVPLLRLMKGRQRGMLNEALGNLRAQIGGELHRLDR